MERLWLERAASTDWIECLERNMEDMQRNVEDINDTGGGGGYLSRALDEAKYKALTCKDNRLGAEFSSFFEYREEYSDSYRYNSDYVRIFNSVGNIKPDASQNRALSVVGKANKKRWGAFKLG